MQECFVVRRGGGGGKKTRPDFLQGVLCFDGEFIEPEILSDDDFEVEESVNIISAFMTNNNITKVAMFVRNTSTTTEGILRLWNMNKDEKVDIDTELIIPYNSEILLDSVNNNSYTATGYRVFILTVEPNTMYRIDDINNNNNIIITNILQYVDDKEIYPSLISTDSNELLCSRYSSKYIKTSSEKAFIGFFDNGMLYVISISKSPNVGIQANSVIIQPQLKIQYNNTWYYITMPTVNLMNTDGVTYYHSYFNMGYFNLITGNVTNPNDEIVSTRYCPDLIFNLLPLADIYLNLEYDEGGN